MFRDSILNRRIDECWDKLPRIQGNFRYARKAGDIMKDVLEIRQMLYCSYANALLVYCEINNLEVGLLYEHLPIKLVQLIKAEYE